MSVLFRLTEERLLAATNSAQDLGGASSVLAASFLATLFPPPPLPPSLLLPSLCPLSPSPPPLPPRLGLPSPPQASWPQGSCLPLPQLLPLGRAQWARPACGSLFYRKVLCPRPHLAPEGRGGDIPAAPARGHLPPGGLVEPPRPRPSPSLPQRPAHQAKGAAARQPFPPAPGRWERGQADGTATGEEATMLSGVFTSLLHFLSATALEPKYHRHIFPDGETEAWSCDMICPVTGSARG